MSDTVVLFDRDGRIHSEIDLFDVLDTNRITADSYLPYWRLQGWDKTLDWSHANCIVEDPNDGGLLLSLRHQDAVIKITRAGELVWILGNPGGWQGQWKDKLLTIDGGEPFYHQHDLSITTRGELMLFNNGANPDQPIETRESFVLCYQIDEKAMTATETWRFGGQSIPYSHYVSGACELNNGNIFVACTGLTHDLDGNRVAIPPKGVGAIEVFEVTRDGESIMHARLEKKGAQPNAGWNGFRPEFLTAEVAMQLGQK